MAESPAGVEEPETQEAPPPPRVRPAPAPPQTLPPHVVFLHNDPHNSEGFVVFVLQKVLALPRARATRMMNVAHRRGRCAVWSGHRELAELKAQQITAAGPDPLVLAMGDPCQPLKATVEKAPG